jgi:YidC/Oxa1 family membrane protein insertase
MNFVAKLFGQLMYFIYKYLAFENYGLAIILFTLFTKLLMLPLTIRQMKSTSKMQEIQPKIQDIQKRYKNDKEKLNQEMMRVYKENNVNPAGGCLPLLIQLPILLSLFYVITGPLTYMLNKSKEVVETLSAYVSQHVEKMSYHVQIEIMNYFSGHVDELKQFSDLLKPEELINLKFLGLNLGLTPTISTEKLFGPQAATYLPLLLIPIIGVVTTFISSKMMTPPTQSDSDRGGMSNSMMYIGPVLTLMFSFQLPAGVGLYWIAGYVFQIFQQLYINKYVMKKKEVT